MRIRLVKDAGLTACERTRTFPIGTRLRWTGGMMVDISATNSSAKLATLNEVAVSVAIRMSNLSGWAAAGAANLAGVRASAVSQNPIGLRDERRRRTMLGDLACAYLLCQKLRFLFGTAPDTRASCRLIDAACRILSASWACKLSACKPLNLHPPIGTRTTSDSKGTRTPRRRFMRR